MKEKVANLWTEPAEFRCILTSGAVADDGTAIIDSPITRTAASKFAGLDVDLGRLISSRGNHTHILRPGLISFPVKQYQWSGPKLDIITRSARELVQLVGSAVTLLPRPNEGGVPEWEQVAQALDFLPENIIVIQHSG
jgi:hypothetical protein